MRTRKNRKFRPSSRETAADAGLLQKNSARYQQLVQKWRCFLEYRGEILPLTDLLSLIALL